MKNYSYKIQHLEMDVGKPTYSQGSTYAETMEEAATKIYESIIQPLQSEYHRFNINIFGGKDTAFINASFFNEGGCYVKQKYVSIKEESNGEEN